MIDTPHQSSLVEESLCLPPARLGGLKRRACAPWTDADGDRRTLVRASEQTKERTRENRERAFVEDERGRRRERTNERTNAREGSET